MQEVEFGMQLSPVERAGTSDAALYAEALADAQVGYKLGFSTGWMIEHHFSDYFTTPNPLLFLSHVAALCPGFGLGTAVLVLPWYNPLRLAEEIAMLQLLSKGPLHIGMGRGTAKFEYDALGVPMEEARDRFHECWDIVRIALKGEPFTYDGRFHKIQKPITLRPHLDGRRPHFYGAVSSPSSAAIMAAQGLAPLSLLNYSHEVLANIIGDWKKINGENMGAERAVLPLMTNVYIADTDEEARAEAKRYLPIYYKLQVDHYDSENDVWKDMPSYQETGKMMSRLKLYTNPDNLDPQININPIGSPETVRRRLQDLVDIGFNHFIIRNGTPGVPRAVRHKMMQRFAHEVMPQFNVKKRAA